MAVRHVGLTGGPFGLAVSSTFGPIFERNAFVPAAVGFLHPGPLAMGTPDQGSRRLSVLRTPQSGTLLRPVGPVRGGPEVVRRLLLTYFVNDAPAEALPDFCAELVDVAMLLVPAGAKDVWVEEEDIPRFRLPIDGSLRGFDLTHAATVWERARTSVVLGALEAARGKGPHPAFIERAMFEGRVTRARSVDDIPYWVPQLTEADGPSCWALALLAADLWNDPDTYAECLEVCEICGNLRLDARVPGQRCKDHRDHRPETKSDRVITRPEAPRARSQMPSQI